MHWPFLFFTCVLLLFLLPLTPALHEWRRKKDSKPLRVVREYDGNIMHFAFSFRRFLDENFPGFLSETGTSGETVKGSLKNGAPYQIVGHDGKPEFTPLEIGSNATSQIILGKSLLQLPEGMFFEKEVYAERGIAGGNKNCFRAILADQDIRLGDDCDVIRWAHSNQSIAIGFRSRLYGRISAGKEIMLKEQSRFGRMYAAVIRFGEPERDVPGGQTTLTRVHAFAMPPKVIDNAAGRWLVAGTIDMPAASFHRGSLVARKNLVVGRDSFVIGGIKSTGNLRLEGNLRIDGPVVSARSMHIGPGCIIKGPIVSERTIFIAAGTIIGSPDRPTTITAPVIRIEEGVVAYGSVWAREMGHVVGRQKISK